MRWVPIAAVAGALAVAAGAFGAHWLGPRLSPSLMEAYRAGVQYHLVHSVVLLGLALYSRSTGTSTQRTSWLFLLGMILFSGSLYALCLTGIRAFVHVTPVGGLLLIAAWLELARSHWQH